LIGRIGLGTVQFGSHYGVTNKRGQPSRKECDRIIETALDAGIFYFDTAAYYGDADLVLAANLPREGVRVISKAKTIADAFHCYEVFGENLHAICGEHFKARSVYWPDRIPEEVTLVQMPLNLADQRNLPLLHRCKKMGMEVHARSVFLQGLLLERGCTIRQCLKFVLDQPVDVALVGVNSVGELQEIIEAVETLDEETGGMIPIIEQLDPRTWSHANN
jgi:aryl-alcohol dehydrogenase-like predicted oxidoreductase